MWRLLTREMKLQCCSTTTTFVNLKRFRQGERLLAHEFVQPLLDKHSNGDIDVAGPGRRSVNNDVMLRGKHFRVSKHPMRKSCIACAYQKKLMANRKRQKHQTFAKNVVLLMPTYEISMDMDKEEDAEGMHMDAEDVDMEPGVVYVDVNVEVVDKGDEIAML